jgi:predicted nucleotidyltransferase component of viral defense system
MGGTCIHIVHGNPRFSEDLDFDNENLTATDFNNLATIIEKEITREGYIVEVNTNIKKNFRATFRFPSILQRSGLTGHRNQKLLIRVDTEPQHFSYSKESIILNKFDVFCRIRTVPIDILLSQKIVCILTRPRTLGRDFFDTSFLLGKTKPNMEYLKTKLDISGNSEVRQRLVEKCNAIDLKKMAKDVEPFLINPDDRERILLFPQLIQTMML